MIPIGFIKKPSIELNTVAATEAAINDWRTPIITYLREGLLPEDKQKAQKFRMKTARFSLINDVLFRRSFNGPYSCCLNE